MVPSAIGFATWIVDDENERAKGMEQMKRDMDAVAQIGGVRIAAPPTGAQNAKDPGRRLGEGGGATIAPSASWATRPAWCRRWRCGGFPRRSAGSARRRLIAIDSNHPKACVLADVYHLYKGGSDPRGLRLLSGAAMHVIHTNDYPADPPRETITDASRVFPGDGVAPLTQILRDLRDIGFNGFLSLELFNRDYWKRSPVKVAREGIEKMRAVVRKAMA